MTSVSACGSRPARRKAPSQLEIAGVEQGALSDPGRAIAPIPAHDPPEASLPTSLKSPDLAEGQGFKRGDILAKPHLHKARGGGRAENPLVKSGMVAVRMGDKGQLARVARIKPESRCRQMNASLIIDNNHRRS